MQQTFADVGWQSPVDETDQRLPFGGYRAEASEITLVLCGERQWRTADDWLVEASRHDTHSAAQLRDSSCRLLAALSSIIGGLLWASPVG